MTSRLDLPHLPPPKLGVRLLKWLLPDGELAEVAGDLEERFQTKARGRGAAAARIWYGIQILRLVPYLIKDHILWSCIMFKNNLVIAWRNIKKSKAYSALNVLGLAVGMAVFILIMLYVRYELSYDRYHANADRIFRIINEEPINYMGSKFSAVTPGPMAAALVRDFPEVGAAARIQADQDLLIRIGAESFLEKSFYWADPQIFEIFSFPFVRGNQASALKDPFSLLVSEREAGRLFGPADPVGRTILLQIRNKDYEFRVTGVFRDIPANSHFVMDIVAPVETMGKLYQLDLAPWNEIICTTYILLQPGANARDMDA